MAVIERAAFGITYYSISLQEWRKFRTLDDIPRKYWAGLYRAPTNFEYRNRIDYRDGAWPQKGGVDHIGAGFQDDIGADTGAEALCEYGLNPNNTRASWTAGGDSDTICLLLPGDTRPWMHGVEGSPYDLNSWAVGYEDGILKTDWRILPREKRLAHLRMRATFWALFFGTLNWELKYTPDANEVWRLIGQGRSWGLTQHGLMDWANRTDAGLLWAGGGTKINTLPYFTPIAGDPADATLFNYIKQEMAIRAGTLPGTPDLPDLTEQTKQLQGALNEFGYNLDLDGSRGPLTQAAIADLVSFTGWTGDVTNHTALMKHLEDTMAKLDDLYNAVHNIPVAIMTHELRGRDGEPTQVQSFIRGTNFRSKDAADDTNLILERMVALEAAVTALAASKGMTPEQVTEAVDKALSNYRLTLSKAPADAAALTPEEAANG